MKVIELTNRVIFLDDIIEIYEKGYFYYVKTKNGDYCISDTDYKKLKYYLLSLNEPLIKEDKKIPKKIQSCGDNLYSEYIGQWLIHKENYSEYDELLMNKINEIIDYLKSKGE